MTRLSSILGCLLLIAVMTLTEVNAGTWWDYNNKRYYFEDQSILLNVADAENWCSSLGPMTLIGFETTQEWIDVTNFQDTNGNYGKFWTRGVNIARTLEWEWGAGTAPPSFDVSDPRWNIDEPWDNPNWRAEQILYTVPGSPFQSELFSVDNTANYMVACEQM